MNTKTERGGQDDYSDSQVVRKFFKRIHDLVNGLNSNISNKENRWIVVHGAEDQNWEQFNEEISFDDREITEMFMERRDKSDSVVVTACLSSRNEKRKRHVRPDRILFASSLSGVSNSYLPTHHVRQLYNLLSSVQSPVELRIQPDDSDPNMPKIDVVGVNCSIDVWRLDDMKAGTFGFIIQELCIARMTVEEFFRGGMNDNWKDDWFPDDDESGPEEPVIPFPTEPVHAGS